MRIHKDTYTDSYGKTHRISRMLEGHIINVIVIYDRHITVLERIIKMHKNPKFSALLREKKSERMVMINALGDNK